MNLNLTILKDYLPPELQTRLYGEAQDKLVCSRPFLCEADTSVITGNTYLLRAELLPFITPVSGCSFICVGSPVPFNWQESGISLLQINGSSSFLVTPSTVTCFSSIASRSAACVLLDVRLISSASRRFVMIAPGLYCNSPVCIS